MRGKVNEFLPHIRQRLFLRYPTVDTISGTSWQDTEGIASKNAEKYDIILSLGGDGTLHNVINGVARSGKQCIVGVLPFGTCNDVARTLKIPRELDKALDAVLRLNTTKYDLMFDGEQYIAYTLAGGYLTGVSFNTNQKFKRKVGRFAYICAGIKNIFSLKGLPFTFKVDGERIHGQFVYVMLMNGHSAGGFNINKGEDLANGKIKFVAIQKSKGLGALNCFVRLFTRGVNAIRKNKYAYVRDAKMIDIENPSNEAFTLDGEKVKFLTKHIQVTTEIEMITG